MNELSTALQNVIAQAGKSLPATTGVTEKHEARWRDAVPDRTIILADVSGSMAEPAGSQTKIQHLREALATVWSQSPSPLILYEFSSHVARKLPAELSEPSGGTALHLALSEMLAHKPSLTLVISDGHPDDSAAAIAAAQQLTGRIDVIYCGPDSDSDAIAFMRRLATVGGGAVTVADLVKDQNARRLLQRTQQLLGLPAPGAV